MRTLWQMRIRVSDFRLWDMESWRSVYSGCDTGFGLDISSLDFFLMIQ
jgi:hypothetical protein